MEAVINIEDFSKICRLCLACKDCNLQPFLGQTVFDIFNKITGIEFSEKDQLPENVCKDCIEQLKHISDFIQTCISSDKVLRTVVENFVQNQVAEEKRKSEEDIKSEGSDHDDDDDDDDHSKNEVFFNDLVKDEREEQPCDMNLNEHDPVSCLNCSKQFSTRAELVQHKDVFNCGSSDVPLDNDNYVVKEEDDYKIEKEELNADCIKGRKLKGRRLFLCNYCGKNYTRKNGLERHILSHTGVKPFECKECGKRYITKDTLKTHLLTHTGIKAFKCEQCGKCFTQSSHLSYHMKRHQGERPFMCPFCGNRFVSSYHLERHKLMHTGVKPYECNLCGKQIQNNENNVFYHTCTEPHVNLVPETETWDSVDEYSSDCDIQPNYEIHCKIEEYGEGKSLKLLFDESTITTECDVINSDGKEINFVGIPIDKSALDTSEDEYIVHGNKKEGLEAECKTGLKEQNRENKSYYLQIGHHLDGSESKIELPEDSSECKINASELNEDNRTLFQETVEQGVTGDWNTEPKHQNENSSSQCLEILQQEDIGDDDFEWELQDDDIHFQNTESKSKENRNYCAICRKDVTHFSRHISKQHSNEPEVMHILTLPVGSRKRKIACTRLRKKWNYFNKQGVIKAVRKTHTDHESLLPCTNCLGFYNCKYLWRHRKQCLGGATDRKHKVFGQNMLVAHKGDPLLSSTIFVRMRPDKISLIAKKDPLICAFASKRIRTIHKKDITVLSLKMRQLARLLIAIRNLEPNINTLYDVLRLSQFDSILSAIKIEGKYDEKTDQYKNPAYVSSIRHTLIECCKIIQQQHVMSEITDEMQKIINLLIADCRLTHIRGQEKFSNLDSKSKNGTENYSSEYANFDRSAFVISENNLEPELLDNSDKCFKNETELSKPYNKGKRRVLIPWTRDQKQAVNAFFAEHINNRISVKERECIILKEKYPDLLANKDWKKIKVYVQNVQRSMDKLK